MKKLLLLTTLLTCFQVGTYGQLRFGLTGGLQSSKITASASGVSLNTSSVLGFHLGGVAEYAVNDNIYIRPELLFSSKGGVFKSGTSSFKLNTSYIELPIQVLYKYELQSGKLVGGLGPYFGFLLGGTDTGRAISVGTDVKGVDAGLKLIGGYELLEPGLMINLFYNAGLANINPDSDVTIKNSTVGLSLTFLLGER